MNEELIEFLFSQGNEFIVEINNNPDKRMVIKNKHDKTVYIRTIKYEYWYEYDKNNNLIHYKDSYGYETWYEYDENNNEIHRKNSYGNEEWYEYDKNNNLIHYKNSYGKEEWREYDENNNCIHFKSSDGKEYWKKYDDNNNLIHLKDSDGYECWYNGKGYIMTKEEFDNLHNKTTTDINDESKVLLLPGWSKELIDNMNYCPLCGARTCMDDFKWLQIDGGKYICNHCRNIIHK